MTLKNGIAVVALMATTLFIWSPVLGGNGPVPAAGGPTPVGLELTLSASGGTVALESTGTPGTWSMLHVKVRRATAGMSDHFFPVQFDANGSWSGVWALEEFHQLCDFQLDLRVYAMEAGHVVCSRSLTLRGDQVSGQALTVPVPGSGSFSAPVAGTVAPLFPVQWVSQPISQGGHAGTAFIFYAAPTGVEGEIPVN